MSFISRTLKVHLHIDHSPTVVDHRKRDHHSRKLQGLRILQGLSLALHFNNPDSPYSVGQPDPPAYENGIQQPRLARLLSSPVPRRSRQDPSCGLARRQQSPRYPNSLRRGEHPQLAFASAKGTEWSPVIPHWQSQIAL